MLTIHPRPSMDHLLSSMEIAANPMFLLSVDEHEVMRFAGLNSAHEAATGLSGAAIKGKTPHEILPPRTADTVLANYTECLKRKRRFHYEECLELANGRRWWETTLRPISDGTEIFAILGSAFDITARRTEITELRSSMDSQGQEGETGGASVRLGSELARGPLNNILNMGRMLEGASDKQAVADLIVHTAASAISEIDKATADLNSRERATEHVVVDLGHLCRDMLALADPASVLDIEYPDIRLSCAQKPLQVMLQAVIDEVARFTAQRLAIRVQPGGPQGDGVHIVVEYDGLTQANPDIARLATMARHFGHDIKARSEGDFHSLTLSMEGRVLASPANETASRALAEAFASPRHRGNGLLGRMGRLQTAWSTLAPHGKAAHSPVRSGPANGSQ